MAEKKKHTKKIIFVVGLGFIFICLFITVFIYANLQVSRFQKAAIEKQAISTLAGLFQSAHASHAEYEQFPESCEALRFPHKLDGKLYYRVTEKGFEATAQVSGSEKVYYIDQDKKSREYPRHLQGEGVQDCSYTKN